MVGGFKITLAMVLVLDDDTDTLVDCSAVVVAYSYRLFALAGPLNSVGVS